MSLVSRAILIGAFAGLLPVDAPAADQPVPSLRGFVEAHDPSTIIKCKDRYYAFSTGNGILSKSSADKIVWSAGPRVFTNPPAWTTEAVPEFTGTFWAPDILFFNGKYHLYYSVSSWGKQVSAIGLVTNPTLDPADSAYAWTDHGPVIQSGVGSEYNVIDPSFTWDAAGNLWMAFGSYWNGIYLVQLDPGTGLRISPSSPTYRLAWNNSIEACCIYRRGGYYYLFVNWGSCCNGVNSEYNVRVGRSTSITGPYLDRNGVNMINRGGTVFMRGTGKFVGPGHVAILAEGGNEWFSYHYYDANDWAPHYNAYGEAKLGFVPIMWTADDWPVYHDDWAAVYDFERDARDLNGQHTGLLQQGATVRTDPARGRVLDLSGTNQHVWFPPGAGYGQTFTAVVNWRGGPAWQRIFDLGVNTSRYVMLTPASAEGVLRCDLNLGGNVQVLSWNRALPTNEWTQVAVTLDGSRGILHVNGTPVATNSSMNRLPLDVRPQTNHLGRSKFTADPHFNGQISSFRSYGRVLTAAEIAAPLPRIHQPANGAFYSPDSRFEFSGSATDFSDLPLAVDALSWRVQYVQDGKTNLVLGPVSNISRGAFMIPPTSTGGGLYQVVLSASQGSRQTSVSSTLYPQHPAPPWAAWFPLRGDAADAHGRFGAALHGGANFVNDPQRGEVLNLSGSSQYLSFAPGVDQMQTFMAWVKWNGGQAWQRIFDFGNDTTHYTMLSPYASNGKLRLNISLAGIPGEQVTDAPTSLPVGVWTHVAVTYDGQSVVLYTNGAPIATNRFANLVPAHLRATNLFLGKSNWPDPYFSGRLSSVRMFSRPLAHHEIVAPQVHISMPPHGALYASGQTVSFSGTAQDFFDASIAPTGMTWTVRAIVSGATNTVFGPVAGIASGSFSVPTTGAVTSNGFLQISLTAIDVSGRRATNSIQIFPAHAPAAQWTSFYPFSTGAQDASNRFNGTLLGGASIQNDTTQGSVLNLSGNSQYLQLPAAAASAQVVSAWVRWNGGNAWQRIFDFGRNTQQWFYLCPRIGAGMMECALTTDLASFNRIIRATAPLPMNQWVHVSVVMDGKQGILYLDGEAIAVNNSVDLLPSDIAALNAYVGRSQYTADPYFNGRIDSLLLSSDPEATLDATVSARWLGSAVQVSWPAWDGTMVLYGTPSLEPAAPWSPVPGTPVLANGLWNLTITATNTAGYFRLQPR